MQHCDRFCQLLFFKIPSPVHKPMANVPWKLLFQLTVLINLKFKDEVFTRKMSLLPEVTLSTSGKLSFGDTDFRSIIHVIRQLLHFASIVITFCVSIIFCGSGQNTALAFCKHLYPCVYQSVCNSSYPAVFRGVDAMEHMFGIRQIWDSAKGGSM